MRGQVKRKVANDIYAKCLTCNYKTKLLEFLLAGNCFQSISLLFLNPLKTRGNSNPE